MKLRTAINFSSISNDTIVGFFYAVHDGKCVPYYLRDSLYSHIYHEEYVVTSYDKGYDNDDEYVSLEVDRLDRLYRFADVKKAYDYMVKEGYYCPDSEKFFIYITKDHIVEIEELLVID